MNDVMIVLYVAVLALMIFLTYWLVERRRYEIDRDRRRRNYLARVAREQNYWTDVTDEHNRMLHGYTK